MTRARVVLSEMGGTSVDVLGQVKQAVGHLKGACDALIAAKVGARDHSDNESAVVVGAALDSTHQAMEFLMAYKEFS